MYTIELSPEQWSKIYGFLSDCSDVYVGNKPECKRFLTLFDSTISENVAASGGGIYTISNTHTYTNIIVSGNSADSGGGIFNDEGWVELINSTVSGNTASGSGGGILNWGSLGAGVLTLTLATATLEPTSSAPRQSLFQACRNEA